MAPRPQIFQLPKPLSLRQRTSCSRWPTTVPARIDSRSYSDKKDPEPPTPSRSERAETSHNMHASEEAAALSQATGGKGPDLQQGTPVEEVVKGDKKTQESLPKVMKDSLKEQKRSFSSVARRHQMNMQMPPGSMTDIDAALFGTKPIVPAPRLEDLDPKGKPRHLHNRYQTIVEQLVGLMIKDGKKAAAQRNVSLILSHLRTSPAPALATARLLPPCPAAAALPLDPVAYLTLAIDSVAPILRMKQLKGAAGGGVSLPVPIPLGQRRRRWEAIHWILEAASKRTGKGSGKGMFAQRVAEELVAVVEGRSAIWARRDALHKQGVVARANSNTDRRAKRRIG